VEKVLQMSLYDGDNIALKFLPLDANELIDSVVQTFNIKVVQNGGSIETKLDAVNSVVKADEMHFTNIVFNLMDNAVKYKRDDVALHLEVSTWNESGNLYIQISDNGIGIQKDNLKRIFDKFYRVHTGNLHDVKGFGLGLAYVKQIIHAHKGSIKAESEVGVGTNFIIVLPLK
jgi:two-component system phosphate regulon sensor histidine kinase PhoR